jgi:hypothetical protein
VEKLRMPVQEPESSGALQASADKTELYLSCDGG